MEQRRMTLLAWRRGRIRLIPWVILFQRGLSWSITEFEEEENEEGADKDGEREQQAHDIEDQVFPGGGKTKGLQDFISCHGKSNTRLLIGGMQR